MVGSLGVVLAVLCVPTQGSVVVAPSAGDRSSRLDQYISIPSGQSTDTSSVVTWAPANPAETVVTLTSPDGTSKTLTYSANGEATSTGLIIPSRKDGQSEKMYIVTLGEGIDPSKIDGMADGVGTDPSMIDPMAFGVLPKAGETPGTLPSYTITLPPGTTLPLLPGTRISCPSRRCLCRASKRFGRSKTNIVHDRNRKRFRSPRGIIMAG